MSKMSLSVDPKYAKATKPQAEYGPEVAVARLAQADRAIAEAITATDAVRLVAGAQALAEWARAVHAGEEHERQAAIFVLRAKRNAGQRIAEAQARGEVMPHGRPSEVARGDLTPATLSDIGVTRDQSSEWKRLASEWSDDALTAAAEEMVRPSLTGIQQRSPGMFTSDTPEWYTPRHILDAVVSAMGGIDLDPCAEAARSVPAARHYTESDDGLGRPWEGRVYMNPPYGRVIGAWVDKLGDEFDTGNVTEAVALVPARTDTAWFAHLPWTMTAFITGRLSFSEHENAAPFPSAACYLGPNSKAFAEAFISLGIIAVRLEVGQ